MLSPRSIVLEGRERKRLSEKGDKQWDYFSEQIAVCKKNKTFITRRARVRYDSGAVEMLSTRSIVLVGQARKRLSEKEDKQLEYFSEQIAVCKKIKPS